MNKIPLVIEDTSLEILARIARAEASKYDCSINIDFSGNKRTINFVGKKEFAPHIIEDVQNILSK